MKKPSDTKIWLYQNSYIKALSVRFEVYDCDKSRSFVLITSSKGDGKTATREVSLEVLRPLLILRLDWQSVAEVREDIMNEVAEWLKFEKKNKADLATYKRLKEKFE